MQRAYDSSRPQATLTHPGMSVRADVVHCVDSIARVADGDFPASEGHGTHGALRNFGKGQSRLKLGFIHISISVSKMEMA
jgi:hypothetical protein